MYVTVTDLPRFKNRGMYYLLLAWTSAHRTCTVYNDEEMLRREGDIKYPVWEAGRTGRPSARGATGGDDWPPPLRSLLLLTLPTSRKCSLHADQFLIESS